MHEITFAFQVAGQNQFLSQIAQVRGAARLAWNGESRGLNELELLPRRGNTCGATPNDVGSTGLTHGFLFDRFPLPLTGLIMGSSSRDA